METIHPSKTFLAQNLMAIRPASAATIKLVLSDRVDLLLKVVPKLVSAEDTVPNGGTLYDLALAQGSSKAAELLFEYASDEFKSRYRQSDSPAEQVNVSVADGDSEAEIEAEIETEFDGQPSLADIGLGDDFFDSLLNPPDSEERRLKAKEFTELVRSESSEIVRAISVGSADLRFDCDTSEDLDDDLFGGLEGFSSFTGEEKEESVKPPFVGSPASSIDPPRISGISQKREQSSPARAGLPSTNVRWAESARSAQLQTLGRRLPASFVQSVPIFGTPVRIGDSANQQADLANQLEMHRVIVEAPLSSSDLTYITERLGQSDLATLVRRAITFVSQL